MARPNKIGLEYFPFDVDFFQDLKIRKLVRSQGGKAVTVYALLLCNIYKNGYYMRWDTELPFIISEVTGYDEVYIQEVVKYCLSIDLFSRDLFEREGVLTSKGIQERYKLVCARRSCNIDEYSLISGHNKGVSVTETGVVAVETMVSVTKTPIDAAISAERKEKEREKEISPDGDTKKSPEGLFPPASRESSQKRFRKPAVEEISAYCMERGNGIDAQGFFDYYESKGWVVGKSPMKDWKAAVRNWERMDRQNRSRNPNPPREPVQYTRIEQIENY